VWLSTLGLFLAGCADEVPDELRPDSLLRDSLGLTPADAVHVVAVAVVEGRETATPARTLVRPGQWVSFATRDGRLHHVRFDTTTTPAELDRWLAAGRRLRSPPLLNRDSRWVVDFADAPVGVYPFRLEGTGATGGGVVQVVEGR
jgi:plastocyanin